MAEDASESTSNGDEQPDDAGAEAAGEKRSKTFARRANNNLRLARRSLEEVEWQPDERAQHLVAEANVLALLELADAVRSAREPADLLSDGS